MNGEDVVDLRLTHRRTGTNAPIKPLLKKILDAGVEAGFVVRPPCFVPEEE